MKTYLLVLITSLFLVAKNSAEDATYTAKDSSENRDITYLKNMPASIAAIANLNSPSNKYVNKSAAAVTMEFEMQKLAKSLKAKILF